MLTNEDEKRAVTAREMPLQYLSGGRPRNHISGFEIFLSLCGADPFSSFSLSKIGVNACYKNVK
jgi:hypothetical protein